MLTDSFHFWMSCLGSFSLNVCKDRVVTDLDTGNVPGCLTCQMREMLETFLVFATLPPNVEVISRGESNYHYAFFWSVLSILVQRDLLHNKPIIMWKIYKGSWDSIQTHLVSANENIGGIFSIFLLPIPFCDCVSGRNSQRFWNTGAVVKNPFVHMSACNVLQRLATSFFFTFQYLKSILIIRF